MEEEELPRAGVCPPRLRPRYLPPPVALSRGVPTSPAGRRGVAAAGSPAPRLRQRPGVWAAVARGRL